MRAARLLLVLFLLPLSASAVPEDADDWKLVGGVLAIVQQIVHLAAHAPDPNAAQRGVDAILSGEDAQANRIASGMLDEVLQDVPAAQRGAFVAIGRDLLVLARRERVRAAAQSCAAPRNPLPAR